MSLNDIITQLEFCSARLHTAEGAELQKLKEVLLELKQQLEQLCLQ